MNEKENYGRKIYKHIVSGVIDYSPTSLLGRQRIPCPGKRAGILLTFNMTRAGGDIVGNTLVYLLMDREVMLESSTIRFREVTYGPDRLSMTVAAGMWNIAL